MTEIEPPTEIDIRLHALNLAARQMAAMFEVEVESSKPTSVAEIAGETLEMARQYRDWLANGDEADTVPGPGCDHSEYVAEVTE